MGLKSILKNTLVVLMILCVMFLVSCNNKEPEGPSIDEDKVMEVMAYIDEIPNTVRISSAEYIEECMNLYNELNNDEKALVENYEKLDAAYKKILYLKDEGKYIKALYEDVKEYIISIVPTEIDTTVSVLNIPKEYNASNEYASYTYRISFESKNERVIANDGTVYHGSEDKNVVLTFTLSNTKISETKYFEIKVKVLKSDAKDVSDCQVVISYMYGQSVEFNDNDYKSIDIVNLCFGQIAEDNGHFSVDVSGVDSLDMIPSLKNRGLRVCISLGGWRDDSDDWIPYQNAAKTNESRKEIAEAILNVLKEYDLDGIDMDWEYPREKDKSNYTLLMQEIKKTLKASNSNYLITAAIPAGSWVLDRYELSKLNNVFDYINLMTYDMDDSGKNTSFHSALYSSNYAPYNANSGIEFFHNNGVDYAKLVIGIAFYGRVFFDVNDNGNGGLGAKYNSKDEISYDEIKNDYLARIGHGVTEYYNEAWGANYLYDSENKVFICYDGLGAVAAKCDYAIDKGLGGVMYWAYREDMTGDLMQVITDKYDDLKHVSK